MLLPAQISFCINDYKILKKEKGSLFLLWHMSLLLERAGKRPKLLEHLQIQPAESSRLLAAVEKRKRKREVNQNNDVSYRRVVKADGKNV